MPIPLILIIQSLIAGGSLVPHAAGGLIVTAANGAGYVAGTYLSTAAVAGLLTGGLTFLGAGLAATIGSVGIFGTTIGATGMTGFLMSLGLISSTPIWIPLAIGGGFFGFLAGAYKFHKLRRKVCKVLPGQEAHFTEAEAQTIQKILFLAARYKKFWRS